MREEGRRKKKKKEKKKITRGFVITGCGAFSNLVRKDHFNEHCSRFLFGFYGGVGGM